MSTMVMIPLYVQAVGILAPGLAGWNAARAVLAGSVPYTPAPLAPLKPQRLAPDVRRRTTDHIRMAVEVATEATQTLGEAVRELPSIFASAESDGVITHDICMEVAKDNPQVSPTRFHNSVNNAPAGYWCMAIGSQAPSTSVAAYDGTFAAGLLEAGMQLLAETPSVLLVAHDAPLPEPLHHVRPFASIFGTALVFSRTRSDSTMAKLDLSLADGAAETTCHEPNLEQLRRGNPAARSLPLLAAIAAGRRESVHLPYLNDQGLIVRVDPLI